MKGQGLHGLSITVKFFMEFFVVSVISDQATVVDCYRLFFFLSFASFRDRRKVNLTL